MNVLVLVAHKGGGRSYLYSTLAMSTNTAVWKVQQQFAQDFAPVDLNDWSFTAVVPIFEPTPQHLIDVGHEA